MGLNRETDDDDLDGEEEEEEDGDMRPVVLFLGVSFDTKEEDFDDCVPSIFRDTA